MNEKFNETMRFEPQKETVEVKDILTKVYSALEKKGYDQKSNNRLHSIWRSYLYY